MYTVKVEDNYLTANTITISFLRNELNSDNKIRLNIHITHVYSYNNEDFKLVCKKGI